MVRAMSTLEGSYRLTRIISIKKTLYLVHGLLLFVLALVLMMYSGASFDPFFIPVDSFIYFVILMMFVILLESFFFRMLEIKYNPSTSRKFLMAKNSIRTALMITIICMVFAGLLLAPFVVDNLEAQIGKETTFQSNQNIRIATGDHLGLTKLDSVRIELVSVSGGSPHVYLMKEEDVAAYLKNPDEKILQKSQNYFYSNIDEPLTLAPRTQDEYEEFVLFFIVTDGGSGKARVTFTTSVSERFTTVVPLLLVGLGVANIAWVVYLAPIKKKYQKGSIYA